MGDGPPLLFIHGVGMNAGAYRPLLKRLATTWRVLAPDMPGAMGTPMLPGEPTLEAYAKRIAECVAERGARPAVVVGHSLGGGVALSMAAAGLPVERLVLINSCGAGATWSQAGLLWRFFFLKNLQVVLSPSAWPAVWRVLPYFLANLLRRPFATRRLGRLAIAAARLRHPGLAPPVRFTFVTARSDVLFPPGLFHELARGLPWSRVIEVDGGHDWPLIWPGKAAEILLRELENSGGGRR